MAISQQILVAKLEGAKAAAAKGAAGKTFTIANVTLNSPLTKSALDTSGLA